MKNNGYGQYLLQWLKDKIHPQLESNDSSNARADPRGVGGPAGAPFRMLGRRRRVAAGRTVLSLPRQLLLKPRLSRFPQPH
jgi:hypothetical protein